MSAGRFSRDSQRFSHAARARFSSPGKSVPEAGLPGGGQLFEKITRLGGPARRKARLAHGLGREVRFFFISFPRFFNLARAAPPPGALHGCSAPGGWCHAHPDGHGPGPAGQRGVGSGSAWEKAWKNALFFRSRVVLDSSPSEGIRDIFTRCVRVVSVSIGPLEPAAPEPPAGGQGWPSGEMTHDAPLAAGIGDFSPRCPASARRSRPFLHAVETTPRCASRSKVRPPREEGNRFQLEGVRANRLNR